MHGYSVHAGLVIRVESRYTISLPPPPSLTYTTTLSRCQTATSPFLTRHSVGKQRALELAKRARTNDKSAWNMLLWRRREEEISDIICQASTNTFCSVIPRKLTTLKQFPIDIGHKCARPRLNLMNFTQGPATPVQCLPLWSPFHMPDSAWCMHKKVSGNGGRFCE